MRIRCWADLQAFWKDNGGPTEAETKLIAHCKAGTGCALGDGTRPELPAAGETPDPSRHIRAEVLRYLIVGGCKDCAVDEIGVQLMGACVTGRLNLSMAKARGQTTLIHCAFSEQIYALQSRLNLLSLVGSLLA